jgi:hypothetical protein
MHNAECPYAECRNAEFLYVECDGTYHYTQVITPVKYFIVQAQLIILVKPLMEYLYCRYDLKLNLKRFCEHFKLSWNSFYDSLIQTNVCREIG